MRIMASPHESKQDIRWLLSHVVPHTQPTSPKMPTAGLRRQLPYSSTEHIMLQRAQLMSQQLLPCHLHHRFWVNDKGQKIHEDPDAYKYVWVSGRLGHQAPADDKPALLCTARR